MRYRSRPRWLARQLRDGNTIANPRVAVSYSAQPNIVIVPRAASRPTVLTSLTPVEDRRAYHPLGRARPAKQVSGVRSQFKAGLLPGFSFGSSSPSFSLFSGAKVSRAGGVAFKAPNRTVICIRRKRRKQVILALGHGGRVSRRRRNQHFSEVRC